MKIKASLLKNLIFLSNEVFNTTFRKKFEIVSNTEEDISKIFFSEDLHKRLIQINIILDDIKAPCLESFRFYIRGILLIIETL